jgi:DNA-binding protein HU-beta
MGVSTRPADSCRDGPLQLPYFRAVRVWRQVVAMMEEIKLAVTSNERVSVPGFGTFQAKERAERNGRNPKTGEPLVIAATRAPGFTPSKTFKDQVKEQYLKEAK